MLWTEIILVTFLIYLIHFHMLWTVYYLPVTMEEKGRRSKEVEWCRLLRFTNEYVIGVLNELRIKEKGNVREVKFFSPSFFLEW